jgi:hypothetical protein
MSSLSERTLALTPPHGWAECRDVCAELVRADPSLDPGSVRFRSAVILLLGDALRQNVERIARVTGYERSFVARVARRFVDHGIWRNGKTIGAWTQSSLGPAFWSDVDVGIGSRIRRHRDAGGFEWESPGSWWKCFDFSRPDEERGQVIRYSAAVSGGAMADPYAERETGTEDRDNAFGRGPSHISGCPEPFPDAVWLC